LALVVKDQHDRRALLDLTSTGDDPEIVQVERLKDRRTKLPALGAYGVLLSKESRPLFRRMSEPELAAKPLCASFYHCYTGR
jgi:hypothetical protein